VKAGIGVSVVARRGPLGIEVDADAEDETRIGSVEGGGLGVASGVGTIRERE